MFDNVLLASARKGRCRRPDWGHGTLPTGAYPRQARVWVTPRRPTSDTLSTSIRRLGNAFKPTHLLGEVQGPASGVVQDPLFGFTVLLFFMI